MNIIGKINKYNCIKLKKNIYSKSAYRFKRLSVKQVMKITGLELPKKLKHIENKKATEIVFSKKSIKPKCIFFCKNTKLLTSKDLKKIKDNCLLLVTNVPFDDINNLVVDKPFKYGQEILKYYRNLYHPAVIAVTGSVGKTSTKEMIESVLSEKYKAKMIVSKGNSNSFWKAQSNIKKLTPFDKVLLQEVGAGSNAYDIVKDSAVSLQADIAVYTNIKDNHIEWYGSREEIAKEKFTLSDYGKEDGLAIVNYDDEILKKHKFKQKTLSYSLSSKKANYYAKNIKVTSDGTSFTLVDNVLNKNIEINLSVIGEYHVSNAIVSYIVGKQLKEKDQDIIEGMKKYKTSGQRQNLIDIGKYKVLADCYNSSYDAISNILKTFDIIKTNGRKIAVIGDIFELGEISEKVHRDVGKLLSKHKIDKIFLIGKNSLYSYKEYKKYKNNVTYCKTREELIEKISGYIKQDDLILFKASHGMQFAELIDTMFGTGIGEKSSRGHKEYKEKKDDKFKYAIFENHATIDECYSKEKEILIPSVIKDKKIEKIGKAVFKNNHKIKKIVITDNIVSIKTRCFRGSSLEKIEIGKNLKNIGSYAFYRCNRLKEITLNEGMLEIKNKAFANCKKLKKIIIPSSVQKIGDNAFDGSKNVTIYAPKKSYAEKFAKSKNISYKYIKK